MKLFRILFLCLLPVAVEASGIDKLKAFVQNTRSAKAQFNQKVLDRNSRLTQQGNGVMEFSRPGRFRWTYEKPYPQLIVGDGAKVWMYDADLNQVTVRKLDEALGSTPAALLAGDNAIEKNFHLKDLGRQAGLDWLEATPKAKESGFESVRMGFGETTLEVMELRDHFGQTTAIRFSSLERNPKLAPELFKFTPPKGADVIGE